MADPRRSCGPMLLCRRIGSPLPGVPPGDDAHDGAIFIFGLHGQVYYVAKANENQRVKNGKRITELSSPNQTQNIR